MVLLHEFAHVIYWLLSAMVSGFRFCTKWGEYLQNQLSKVFRWRLWGDQATCQSRLMTRPGSLKVSQFMTVCNGKLWYSNINRFCNFDMFRNFVKNSNPMCDVALSMWLLFSLFPRNWQVLRQQRARTSKNTGAPPWQKPGTARTSENRLFLRC